MLVGIDASRAVSPRPTGTENYSREVIRHLLALGGHRFRLYFNTPPPPDFPLGDAEARVIPFPRLWTHLRLSWEMLTDSPDVLFVPAHVIPLIHPRRSLVTVHDLGYKYYPDAHPLLDRLYLDISTRWNVKAASLVIADSYATRDDLIRFYRVPPEKIRVIYPGYDADLFRPVRDEKRIQDVKARYGIEGDYFLFVGTIQPRKNIRRLLEAFALFRRSTLARVKLVIAGKKGWLYHKAVAGGDGDVLFVGYVARDDLPALISGARLFVFPSLYEGFGFPVLEAMACGTPVLCSNASSLPEVAGNAAILVNPLDVEAMARKMERVWKEGVPEELIRRGFERARSFSWDECAQQVMRALEDGDLTPHP